MTDQFPVIRTASNTIATTTTDKKSSTLLGRGLAAIQSQQLVIADQDQRYRQARDIYNRITDYGWINHVYSKDIPKHSGQFDLFEDNPLQPYFDKLQQLVDVFTVFQQLADKGYGKAYFPLARMYGGGQGINENIEKKEYYNRLAFNWCFANQGLNDPEIWTDLGYMYQNGQGLEQDDELAVFWYRKAAEQGYASGQFNLGWMYDNGRGLEQDDELAVYWYRKAAEQGHARGQFNLGLMYQNGRGIEQDDELAVFWYRKAADQGYARGQGNLGWMYQNGRGVEQDDEKAVFWYRKAAEQGNTTAQENLTKRGINWKDA